MLAEVQLPLQDSEVDARGYDDERGEVGGFGSAHGKVGGGAADGGWLLGVVRGRAFGFRRLCCVCVFSWVQRGAAMGASSCSWCFPLDYFPHNFPLLSPPIPHHDQVNIVQQINHDGEVNRARAMPQDKFKIATKTVSAEVRCWGGGARDNALGNCLGSSALGDLWVCAPCALVRGRVSPPPDRRCLAPPPARRPSQHPPTRPHDAPGVGV